MKRMFRDKWNVDGEYGGAFSNLDEAKLCAREASKTEEYDYSASIMNMDDGMYYFDYEHGRCVRDGWSLPLKRTGETGKFNLDGHILEKTIYTKPDGTRVIRHNKQIYLIN